MHLVHNTLELRTGDKDAVQNLVGAAQHCAKAMLKENGGSWTSGSAYLNDTAVVLSKVLEQRDHARERLDAVQDLLKAAGLQISESEAEGLRLERIAGDFGDALPLDALEDGQPTGWTPPSPEEVEPDGHDLLLEEDALDRAQRQAAISIPA